MTLEPEGASVIGSLELAPGSVYAEVQVGSSEVGEQVIYEVQTGGWQTHRVPRARLRLRQRRTIAFACVCNEKRHDAPTTQHFLNRILRYFMGHPTPAPGPPPPAPQPPPHQFQWNEWFWGLIHHSDNASHFKSNKMLHFWSTVKANPPSPPSTSPVTAAASAAAINASGANRAAEAAHNRATAERD